jgi:hypothetical protein
VERTNDEHDEVVARLGEARAEELAAELEPHGLTVVPTWLLDSLLGDAARYQRFAALVDPPPTDE